MNRLVTFADGWVISEAHVSYGGVAPKTIMATRTQSALQGKPFTDATLQSALKAVAEDVNITPNAPGRLPIGYMLLAQEQGIRKSCLKSRFLSIP